MKKAAIFLLTILIVWACAKVPFTDRRQVKLLPSSQLDAMAIDNYSTFMSENKISTNRSQEQMVKKVGAKLKDALLQYAKTSGISKSISSYNWEFNLVESPDVNAWAMPGGKVVFYTGIMPICKDDAGVAAVMGHEIAHVLAHHGNERMSQGLITQFGGMALQVAINEKPEATKTLFMTAYGVGTQVGVMLPFSRLHESEADRIGLIIMAMAGYDPHVAVDFWARMSKTGGNQTPEFLSTHPAHSTRIANLNKHMPEALKYYKK